MQMNANYLKKLIQGSGLPLLMTQWKNWSNEPTIFFLPVNNAQSSGRDYAISNKIAPTNSITVNGFELIT
jgi:hypothetical protein